MEVTNTFPGPTVTSSANTSSIRYIPGAGPNLSADVIEKGMADNCPLGRIALPEDVARVVAFLASGDGGWVNGEHTLRQHLLASHRY